MPCSAWSKKNMAFKINCGGPKLLLDLGRGMSYNPIVEKSKPTVLSRETVCDPGMQKPCGNVTGNANGALASAPLTKWR